MEKVAMEGSISGDTSTCPWSSRRRPRGETLAPSLPCRCQRAPSSKARAEPAAAGLSLPSVRWAMRGCSGASRRRSAGTGVARAGMLRQGHSLAYGCDSVGVKHRLLWPMTAAVDGGHANRWSRCGACDDVAGDGRGWSAAKGMHPLAAVMPLQLLPETSGPLSPSRPLRHQCKL
jgi:hypothetical protein